MDERARMTSQRAIGYFKEELSPLRQKLLEDITKHSGFSADDMGLYFLLRSDPEYLSFYRAVS